MVTAFVLGIVLFIKGFGLDERLAAMRPDCPPRTGPKHSYRGHRRDTRPPGATRG